MELMIVIGIMLLAMGIAIPAYNTTIKPTAELKGAVRRLFSDIQLARLRAVSGNVNYGLAFYSGPDRYAVFVDDSPGNAQYDAGEQVVRQVTLADDYGNVGYDTGCASCGPDGISFPNNTFSMTPRGLATVGGTVYLKNAKNEGRCVAVNTMGGIRMTSYNP